MPAGMADTVPEYLSIDGFDVPFVVRRNARARAISIRIDHAARCVVLVLPRRASLRSGLRFVDEKSPWIAKRIGMLPEPVALADGAVVPFLGEPHMLRHVAEAPRRVAVVDGEIRSGGPADLFAPRIGRWMRAEARRAIEPRAERHATAIGAKIARISIRDTRSRWGSASADGRLSFSWRLVLAPEWVLDYVVAHEVAHLREMHHGPAFWRLVDRLVGDAAPAKRWLRAHGTDLYRYG